jgi:mannosyltransferase OCH1-like enzyme
MKRKLKDDLRKITSFCAAGDIDRARDLLDSLQKHPDINELGQLTSLGMPRQLQSALLRLAKAENDRLSTIGYQYHLVPPPDMLRAHTQFTSEQRRAIANANRENIPRLIHQIWIGAKSPPRSTEAWNHHAALHGYEYKLWLEDDLRSMGYDKHPLFAEMAGIGNLPGAVDVARYQVMKDFGGVYLDCDWYPARNDLSFHDFLPMTGMTAMAEEKPRNTGKGALLLANSLIAAPPSHPIFPRLIAALETISDQLPGAPAWWMSGPLIFTLMCREGAITLADASVIAGELPQSTSPADVESWCTKSQALDQGLLLSWKSWIW